MPAARFARKASPQPDAGARMTAALAADVLGINRRKDGDLREMVKALGLMTHRNTVEDDLRREAASWALRKWAAYQDECSRRRGAKPVDPLVKASRLAVYMVADRLGRSPSEDLRAESSSLQEAIDLGDDLSGPASALLAGLESRGEARDHGGVAWASERLRALVPEAPAPGR